MYDRFVAILEELSRIKEIPFILLAIIAILIFLLFIYIISSRNQKHSSIIGIKRTSGNGIKSNVSPEQPRKERNNNFNQQSTSPNQLDNNQKCILNHEPDPQPNEGYSGLIIKTDKKQSQIQQTLNADGTIRTEINFDSTNDEPAVEPVCPKYAYLQTANKGQFRKMLPSDEKAFFRTWIEDGVRMFEFHGNVEKALANMNAIFDDVCEIEGKQNGATQIINIKPGTLDNKLKVETRAIIKVS